jgi:hypothetical protein
MQILRKAQSPHEVHGGDILTFSPMVSRVSLTPVIQRGEFSSRTCSSTSDKRSCRCDGKAPCRRQLDSALTPAAEWPQDHGLHLRREANNLSWLACSCLLTAPTHLHDPGYARPQLLNDAVHLQAAPLPGCWLFTSAALHLHSRATCCPDVDVFVSGQRTQPGRS